MKYMVLVFTSLILTACGVGGYWMIGDPSVGRNLKPYLHYWEKPGMTEEGRWADSMGCGSGENDSAEPAPVYIKAAKRDDETYEQARRRIRDEWSDCMEAKGYRDVRD